MDSIFNDIFYLAAQEETDWDAILAAIPEWHPRNETGGKTGEKEGETDPPENDDDNDDDDDDEKKETDWKKMARKWERQAKTERKSREDAQKKVKERDEADQSEHEKAVTAARDEGAKTERDKADKERRTDRLENATLKLAGRGVKLTVKDGDDEKEVTIRFADPDDAFTYVERMIRRGDLEEDVIFDDKGRVDNDALKEALTDLLEDKPHLQASAAGTNGGDGGKRKVKGSADGGKGSSSGKSMEEMSPGDFFEKIQERK